MRVLVTGGAGFIGSHLAEALLARGDTVAVVDDLSTGALGNVAHLRSNPRFTFIRASVLEERELGPLVHEADLVFHAAAGVGVRLIIEHPSRTIDTNVRGTDTVLRLAAASGAKVVLTSSSEVYGRSAAVPFHEGAELVLGPTSNPRWSYACSKAMSEFMALAHARESGLSVVIARIFNTVGPRQIGRYGMVVPTFVEQAIAGRPLTVFGDGRQSRAFSDVADTVAALMALAAHPGAVGGVFNVGSDEEITILDLARRVVTLARSESRIELVPYDVAYGADFEDMARRVPDLTRVRRLLGIAPRRRLSDTLTRVIAWRRAVPSRDANDAAVL